ncbi:hypothetical protein QJS10_CPA10g01201 [Acorus calamus]|uniref:RRM domain-containing protein n=1 Tax=Acorus calamus TaxID=4465 RepID=A0AAV9E1C9_ACOCL|nr:hypothetical protein QJS10_CPA10g01201 [Acorus calamus]
MSTRTVKVSNVSLSASERDIKEFFSFSGDIEYVEMQSADEWSQIAHVTFKDSQGAETALLLSPKDSNPGGSSTESAVQKAEDVVSGMLAKGFILGKDALNKAKSFDEKHQLTSTATAKVTSLDKKIGLSEKVSMGAAAVNSKVKEVDQKFQVSEKTKSAFAVAEQKVSTAGSAIMKNRYVFSGAAWVTGAFNKVAKAAGEVGQKTKEKVVVAEGGRQRGVEDDFTQVRLADTPKAADEKGERSSKPPPARGLIL